MDEPDVNHGVLIQPKKFGYQICSNGQSSTRFMLTRWDGTGLCAWLNHYPPPPLPMDLCMHSPQIFESNMICTGPRSPVGNMSGNRCESDCRSRVASLIPARSHTNFRGDWSWNNLYRHPPPFRWIIQEGLLSVTSESMCTKYWLTACSSLPRKKCG